MRNSITPEENPILFASTYEAGRFVKEDQHEKEVKLKQDDLLLINEEEEKAKKEKND